MISNSGRTQELRGCLPRNEVLTQVEDKITEIADSIPGLNSQTMTTRKPTLEGALGMPLDIVSRDYVDGNPFGLEMIQLLRERIAALEDAIEEAIRHQKS